MGQRSQGAAGVWHTDLGQPHLRLKLFHNCRRRSFFLGAMEELVSVGFKALDTDKKCTGLHFFRMVGQAGDGRIGIAIFLQYFEVAVAEQIF